MPIFTAGAAAIAGAIGFTAGTTGFLIAQSLIAAGLAAGVGHLTGAFDTPSGLGQVEDPGVDQRLAANTQNRIPILYGQFMQRGSVVYFEVSEDRKTLYTVITIGEGPVSSIDRVLWDDITVTLGADGEVIAGTSVEGDAVDRLNGNINIQLYGGNATGNNSTYLEGLVDDWTSAHKMTNLVYAVVTVRYNRENDVVGLSDMRFIGTAPISDPSDAVLDQLTNTRYGLGLPATAIDTISFAAAKAYFSANLPYTDANGNEQTAPRFQVNGSINSADPVFERIEAILLGSNSSLRWQGGKYSIFSNKADTVAPFTMTEDRVVGDIQVSEVGLNSVVNQIEVNYGRDPGNNYQRNTLTVTLPTDSLYPNEQRRVRAVDLPLARTFVEAERLAYILLNQSREQLSVKHMATVECMALEAGDVIAYTLANYGWQSKLFRITRVSEIENENGLQYEIEAVEYAASVYDERTHVEPNVAPNTNLPALDNIIAVSNLAITNQAIEASIPSFTLQWTVPNNVLIEEFDIYVNNVQGMFNSPLTTYLRTVRPSTDTYNSGDIVTEVITGLPSGSYHIWVVGRNEFASSAESNTVPLNEWNPTGGAGVIAIRLHENTSLNDPGAPTGANGLGGDWYDPTGEVGTVPTDPDPHWEARGLGVPTGGTTRQKTFTLSGSAATFSESVELDNKETNFELSGLPGQLALTTPAAPWNANFAVSGMAQGVGPDMPAQPWAKDFTFSGTPVSTGPATGRTTMTFSGERATSSMVSDGVNPARQEFIVYDSGTKVASADEIDLIRFGLRVRVSVISNNTLTYSHRHAIPAIEFDETFTFTNITTSAALQTALLNWYEGFSAITDIYDLEIDTSGNRLNFNPKNSNDELGRDHFTAFTEPFPIIAQEAGGTIQIGADTTNDRMIGKTGIFQGLILPNGSTIPGTFTYVVRRNTTDANGSTAILNKIVSGYNSIYSGSITMSRQDIAVNDNVDGTRDNNAHSIVSISKGSITATVNGAAPSLDTTNSYQYFNVSAGDTVVLSGLTITDTQVAFFSQSNATLFVQGSTDSIVTRASESSFARLSIQSPVVNQAAGSVTFTASQSGRVRINTVSVSDNVSFSQASVSRFVFTANSVNNNYFPMTDEFLFDQFEEPHASARALEDATNTGYASTWVVAFDNSDSSGNFANLVLELARGVILPNTTNAQLAQQVKTEIDALGVTDLTTSVSGDSLTINFSGPPKGGAFTSDALSSDNQYRHVRGIYDEGVSTSGQPDPTFNIVENSITRAVAGTDPDAINTVVEVYAGNELIGAINAAIDPDTTSSAIAAAVRSAFASSEASYSATREIGASLVEVVADVAGAANEPRVVIATAGSSATNPNGLAVTEDVITTGVDAVVSGDDTNISLRVDNVEFANLNVAALTNNEIAEAIGSRFGDLANFTGSSTGSTANVIHSVIGPLGEPTVVITNVGANPDDPSVVGTLVVTRTLNSTGTNDVYTGVDGTVSLRIDNAEFSNINVAGMTLAQINSLVRAGFSERSEYTAVLDGGVIEVTNVATGTTNAPSIGITPGVNSDGSPATLAVETTIVSTGESVTIVNGTPSSYTVTVGSDSTAANLVSSASNVTVAEAIAMAINANFSNYVASTNGNIITATSTFEGESPDIVVDLAAGENADESAGTIASVASVARPGSAAGLDLTDTVWEYYIINQEVRVDDDTTMMFANNAIGVRRGLILSVEADDGVSGPTGGFNDDNLALITDSFTTSEFRNNIITTGNINFKVTEFSSTGVDVHVVIRLQGSTDGGTTWNHLGSSTTSRVGTPSNPDNGLRYSLGKPFSDVSANAAGSEDLQLRFERVWFTTPTGASTPQTIVTEPTQANASNFSYSVLIMEEQLQPE